MTAPTAGRPAAGGRRKPLQVVLASHGFQAHYELGFANGLAANGTQVTLLGSDNTLKDKLHPRVRLINIRGSQDASRPKWRKALNMLSYQLRLFLALLLRRGQPVVFIGIFESGYGQTEARLFRLLSSHLSLVVHNILPHGRHSEEMREVYRRLYALPDLLLAHTRSTQSQLVQEFGVEEWRTLIVEHGLNDAARRTGGSTAQAKEALGLPPGAKTVLFFGHVSPFKGLHHLLDVLERRPDFFLLMAGRCTPDDYGNGIRPRVEKLVAAGRARWYDGYVDEATIGRVFSAADVNALPYAHIDQSGVLLLALSLGVPVLATRCGGFLDLVDARNGVFIDEDTPAAVERGLDNFFGLPAFPPEQVAATVAHLRWEHTVAPLVSALAGTPPAQAPSPAMR